MNLLQKIRTVALVNINKLLDAVIDTDNVGAVKQYIRDLETSIGAMTGAAVQATGWLRSEEENLVRVRAQKEEVNESINIILTDENEENDKLATPLEARLIAKEKEEKQLVIAIEDAKKTEKDLNDALSQLSDKHVAMLSRLNELETMEREAKAKESAAEALERAGGAGLDGAEASVDSVDMKIRRNKNVADARFERAMRDVQTDVEKDVLLAKAKQRIEERKKALKK